MNSHLLVYYDHLLASHGERQLPPDLRENQCQYFHFPFGGVNIPFATADDGLSDIVSPVHRFQLTRNKGNRIKETTHYLLPLNSVGVGRWESTPHTCHPQVPP